MTDNTVTIPGLERGKATGDIREHNHEALAAVGLSVESISGEITGLIERLEAATRTNRMAWTITNQDNIVLSPEFAPYQLTVSRTKGNPIFAIRYGKDTLFTFRGESVAELALLAFGRALDVTKHFDRISSVLDGIESRDEAPESVPTKEGYL